ncbi:Cutinase 3 [Colletotrichum tanaceti]|uniref:cutinase n=1 Tax=Colletotrichum tanaceti TaxID=1306861 RepID=A0A4V6DFP5_9PEZI|nr:Cutinase 3 [Colletotrichum tanaceti]
MCNGANGHLIPLQGKQPGPQFIEHLRATLGPQHLAAQGLNYAARLLDNICNGDSCRPSEVLSVATQLRQVLEKCPNSKIMAGGYSQGSAILTKVLSDHLDDQYKKRFAGVVMFGSTVQAKTGGVIPDFPPEATQMICHMLDLVCRIGLKVSAMFGSHRNYGQDTRKAAEFLIARLAQMEGWATIPVVKKIDHRKYEALDYKFPKVFRGAEDGTSYDFDDSPALAKEEGFEPKVVKMFGRGGNRVDKIGFVIEGMEKALEHGGNGGKYDEKTLQDGEILTEVWICEGDKKGKLRIGFMRILGNMGTELKLGIERGKCEHYKVGDDERIVGWYGEAGAEIDSIGPIYKKTNSKDSPV